MWGALVGVRGSPVLVVAVRTSFDRLEESSCHDPRCCSLRSDCGQAGDRTGWRAQERGGPDGHRTSVALCWRVFGGVGSRGSRWFSKLRTGIQVMGMHEGRWWGVSGVLSTVDTGQSGESLAYRALLYGSKEEFLKRPGPPVRRPL
jgi:hypothetical protein